MSRNSASLLFILLLCSSAILHGKDKHPKPAPPVQNDEIQVLAHLPLSGNQVTGFLETHHYRRNYLYAEHVAGKNVSLIDVTNASQPALVADMSFPTGTTDSLVAVAGNAALVSNQPATEQASMRSQTFRIMSFADPLHPMVKQEFDHVTAIAQDERRGLIYLANDTGIWILQQRLAVDPEQAKLQKEIERSIYETP